jgi:protocatechuate 3,4-dioxygenase beta subunit
MERITVRPEMVRGLGNVVDPKLITDYGLYHSSVSEGSDFIDNISTVVFTMVGMLEGVSIVVSGSFVRSTESLTVTATVTDENGDPIEGASVELFKEVN